MFHWKVKLVESLERSLLRSGHLVLLHDGCQPDARDIDRSGSPSFFTRMYRVNLEGHPSNIVLKLVYDLRDGHADFDFIYRPVDTVPPAHGPSDAVKLGGAVSHAISQAPSNTTNGTVTVQ